MIESNGNKILSAEGKLLKKNNLEMLFEKLILELGIDPKDPQVSGTPKRMAKMYIDELFSGLYDPAPKITAFPNTKKYDEMVFLGPIQIKSTCSHHFIPFLGKAYIAYIPAERVVGISKLSRICKWFMRRPQIQEELTKQISDYLEDCLRPKGLAVYIEAQHLCMIARGVEESNSVMKTSDLRGVFRDPAVRQEFFSMVQG